MFENNKPKIDNIKNIFTLNTYSDESFAFKKNIFNQVKSLNYNKSNFITSFIHTKDIINAKVYISRSVPDEDVIDVIDMKAYEDLGLDEAGSYMISSVEIFSDREDREFHIFVAETDILDSYFYDVIRQTKYLDLITPAPLLMRTLYKNEILKSFGVDSFVYFSKNDAVITFYKDGEYIYSKSMEYSLNRIYNQFCKEIGDNVNEEDFYDMLIRKGLSENSTSDWKILKQLFETIFIGINDVLIYTKRAFKIDSIDTIYIGSALGPIVGLDNYGTHYLSIPTQAFNFEYNIASECEYLDQFQYLMLMNALDYLEDNYGHVNLTLYPRPPSFLNRSSGQFLIATAAAVSLSLIYPIVHLLGAYTNDTKNFMLTKQNQKLAVESNKYKTILGKKKDIIKVLDKKTDQFETKYSAKTQTLTAIYDKKVHYKLKSEIFYHISNDLNQFDVHVDKLSSEDDTIELSMVSTDERKITELIKYISEKHFNDIQKIDIKRIDKNHLTNQYNGVLKVELK